MLKDRIRAARKATGKTQKEMALALGITESTYCGYETGKRNPDALKISKIAAILGVSGDYLLDLPEAETENDLQAEESDILAVFRELNAQGRALVLSNARMIAGMAEYRN